MHKLLLLCLLVHQTMSCPTKIQAFNCFYNKADHNHDGIITSKELTHAIDTRLYFWQRPLFHAFGGIGRILNDCDLNKDGNLTQDESLNMNHCMDTCYKRRKTTELFEC